MLKAGMAVTPTRPRAQEDNPAHIGATMSGLVVTVMVQAGQRVAKGDPLLSIEAMKMEMQLVAERTGTIAEVCVQPGDRIQPGDLLVTLMEVGELRDQQARVKLSRPEKTMID